MDPRLDTQRAARSGHGSGLVRVHFDIRPTWADACREAQRRSARLATTECGALRAARRRRVLADEMWVPFNDLSRAVLAQAGALEARLQQVLESGWFVLGPQGRAFADELADFLGAKFVVPVASGTDALELSLRATIPLDRAEVLTAANAGGYTTAAARSAGYRVRYADVDPITHCLSRRSVETAWTPHVGAVVVTHLYGRAADVEEIVTWAHEHGAAVVEDCAQALGARWGERRVGTLADVAAMSFYPTKNLGALGDGGAVCTDRAEVADATARLRQYGWGEKYHIDQTGGRNSRLDEIQAAVLRDRLPLLDGWNARRRDIIETYRARATPPIRVLEASGPGHAGHLAVVECPRRADLQAHLAERRIRSDVHYPVPDHKQPAYAHEYRHVALPVTERLAAEVLSLPLFPELTDDEVKRVADALASFSGD